MGPMAIKTITPDQAATALESGGGAVYIDVRSVEEFRSGHPPRALNIPIAVPNRWGQSVLNPDFLRAVETLFEKDTALLVGCQSGPRSEAACKLLAQAGYSDVSNVLGGFSGARSVFGGLSHPGWLQMGLPVSTEDGDEGSWESILRRARGGV